MSNPEIVVFNNVWQAIAIVSATDFNILDHCDEQDKSLIQWVLQQLVDRDPQLMEPVKDESGCITGFLTVGKGEPRYLEAVCDELRRVGLKAHKVAHSLVPLFTTISKNNKYAPILPQVVPEVLGLDDEHAKLVLEAVTKTSSNGQL